MQMSSWNSRIVDSKITFCKCVYVNIVENGMILIQDIRVRCWRYYYTQLMVLKTISIQIWQRNNDSTIENDTNVLESFNEHTKSNNIS